MDRPDRYEEPATGLLDERIAGGGAVRALHVLGIAALILGASVVLLLVVL